MNAKKLLAIVLSVAMVLSMASFSAFAAGETVTMNGTPYATIGEALQAVADATETGDFVIKIAGEFTEAVTLVQYENKNIILDGGNAATMKATVSIDGMGRNAGRENVTVKGITFDFSDVSDGVSTNGVYILKNSTVPTGNGHNLSYAHNMTIEDCTFIGQPAATVVAIRAEGGGSWNLAINNCKGYDLHSAGQLSSVTGMTVTGGNFYDMSEGGFNLQNSKNVTISGIQLDVPDYGIRMGQASSLESGTYTITDSVIDAGVPVVVRGASAGNTVIEVTDSKLIAAEGNSAISFNEKNQQASGDITVNANSNYWSAGAPDVNYGTLVPTTEDISSYYADENMQNVILCDTDALAAQIAAIAADGTLDLNGTTYAVDYSLVIDKNITIQNGTIIGADGENFVSDAVTPLAVNGATLNLTNVKVIGGKLNEDGPASNNFANAINATDARLNVTGSELIGGDTEADFGENGSAIYAVRTVINIVNSRLATGQSTSANSIGNGIIRATDSDVSLEDTSLYAYPGSEGSHPIIYNSQDSEAFPYDAAVDMSGTMTIEEGSNPLSDIETIVPGEDLAFVGEVDTDSTLIPANKITVAFVDNGLNGEGEANEGKKVYDIVLKAANGMVINELASADLSFLFTSTQAMDYTVEAIAEMNLVQLGNRYEFNYDGVAAYEDTKPEIKIGTLTVNGYGTFDLALTGDNIVNATKKADNLVETFVTPGAAGFGALDDSATITGETIAVPTRKLTVNIDFNNAVAKNETAYQNMMVEISGGDLDVSIPVALGNDNRTVDLTYAEKDGASYTVKADTDNKYVVTFDKVLTKDIAYNVTVSGDGYRTARYTVTMTDAKTLNFWNNVMDVAQVVEEKKATSATKLNFLAGDILEDNKINIYDLSAVVSYFGETGNVENGYAQYDLNRDTKIDSKDVAYVLVSWGN